jgi:transcriptional antiterminator NusG
MAENATTHDPVPSPAALPPAPEAAAHEAARPDTPPADAPEGARADRPEPAPAAAAEPAPDGGKREEAPAAEEATPSNKHWYVVKVQSGREESIKEAIERRVKIEGLDEFFGQIIIPVERVTEIKNGKRVTKERKLYPGYLMCEVEYNDRILYLFRETSGVGDFVGGTLHRPPPPMSDREVNKMLHQQGLKDEPTTVLPGKAPFSLGDRVRVLDGTFSGMEGEVREILEAQGKARVELTIFGRPVPVELEYWHLEEV